MAEKATIVVHSGDIDKVYSAHEIFSRELDRLHDFWGHRLPAEKGGAQ